MHDDPDSTSVTSAADWRNFQTNSHLANFESDSGPIPGSSSLDIIAFMSRRQV